jgi:hypoxanthine phosphoribosyltransferase
MSSRFDRDIIEVLITQEAIARRVAELGREVATVYASSSPLVVGVLKGSALFMADLIRHMDIALEMDFMAIASYASSEQRQSSGAVRITKDLDNVIEGRDVLLVDGLVDTGMTIGYLLRNLEARQPRSIRLCAFLDKQVRRIVKVPIAFRGFEVPDRFVVGYGLDFRQLYRNLPYIGVLSGEATGLSRN